MAAEGQDRLCGSIVVNDATDGHNCLASGCRHDHDTRPDVIRLLALIDYPNGFPFRSCDGAGLADVNVGANTDIVLNVLPEFARQ